MKTTCSSPYMLIWALVSCELLYLTSTMGLDFFNNILRQRFAKYGLYVARYPRTMVAIPLTVGLLLGLGLLRLTFETNMEHLFTPSDSQAKKDRSVAASHFPMNAANNFSATRQIQPVTYGQVIFTAKSEGGMMTLAVLEEILRFDDFMKNETEYVGLPFPTVCAKSSANASCYEDAFLSYLRLHGAKKVAKQSFTFPLTHVGHARVFLGYSLGGTSICGHHKLANFTAVKVHYFLRLEEGDKLGRKWEEAFLHAVFTFNSDLLHLAPYTSHSLEEEFHKNGHAIVPMFVIAFAIMIIFAVGTTALTDWVRTKPLVALLGVCSTFLAILSSIGLLSAIGVKYSIVVGTMPVLLLGIGIDDMFIMVAAWRNTNPEHTVEQRMSDTMCHAAVSVTITSVTDFLAFLIGMITVFPSVFGFCLFTAVAVLFDYIYQITFFAGCLALDGYREDANHHAITFRTVLPTSYASKKSQSYRLWCSGGLKVEGKVVESLKGHTHPANNFFQSYGRFITKPAMKSVVVLLFVGYLGVSIYGCMNVKEGLEMTDLVAEDSYAHKFLHQTDKYFTTYGPRVMFVISEPLNYWDPLTQEQLKVLVNRIEATSYVGQNNLTEFWLFGFMKYSHATGHNIATQKEFLRHLQRFLSKEKFHDFKLDIKFSSDGNSIEASRFYIQTINISTSDTKMSLLREFRDISGDFPVKTFPYNPMFPFYDQYMAVKPNTLQNIGIALVAMCIVAVIMIPHPFCSVLIVLCIVSIDVGVIGIMTYWHVNLDAVSMLSIILCIGFSVDFSAHITYAYMTAKDKKIDGKTRRDEKTIAALSELGWPNVQSAMSTIIGIVPLAFANSYVFQTFFKTLFLVMGLGFIHGIVVLPVIFSLIGPGAGKKDNEDKMGSKESLKDVKWTTTDGPACSSNDEMQENPILTNVKSKVDVPSETKVDVPNKMTVDVLGTTSLPTTSRVSATDVLNTTDAQFYFVPESSV